MKEKILKLEFFALFSLALVSLLALMTHSIFTNNFLQITSDESRVGWISYFIGSFIGFIHYYLGSWAILALMSFVALNFLVFKKRAYFSDIFIFPLLVGSIVSVSSLFFPKMVGQGMQDLMTSTLGIAGLITLSVFFNTILCFSIFEINTYSIKEIKIKYSRFCSLFLSTSKKYYALMHEKFILLRTKLDTIQKTEKIKKIPDNTKINDAKITNPLKTATPIAKSIINKIKESVIEPITDTIIEENPIEQNDLEDDINFDPLQSSSNKATNETNDVFFESSDLINCVTKNNNPKQNINPDNEYFTEIIQALEEKLAEFKLQAKVVNILKGPVVDTFELELGPGVKVSRVNSITNDLSLALCGAQIRIVYPMKGKSTLGVEVPRSPREIIFLDEVLRSHEFSGNNKALPVAMGKDAFGDPIVVDLAKCPHMLVAGSTGAGKSVFINTMLVSLLVKLSPKQLNLILIDPKQLELAVYQKLPHLIMPVITKPQEASLAMLWAVQEMERRYSILAEFGVRHIDTFNNKIKNADNKELMAIHKFYEDQKTEGYSLPYIVIIVDEFADLILTSEGKQIENCVCRLAAKARACGIHLVVATQRPSVDVITGLVKSNFPTRVSFRVTSVNDSRTVLDGGGAEMLLGMGDMLYKHGVDMSRLHSAYVGEEEVEELVQKLSDIPSEFNAAAMEFLENGGNSNDDTGFGSNSFISGELANADNGEDPLFEQAVKIAVESRKISASFLQRRMSVGYNRAAKMIETMEERGIVGPAQGSKPRKVLISSES
jgi:S-DNA-T family DNA segregation ATPase FtsK/SpoIIIE